MDNSIFNAWRVARRWTYDFLTTDWTLKLLALAITLGLWFAVTGQRAPVTVRLRGVQLAFLRPADMEISNDPRDEVEVTVSGSRRALDQLNARNLILNVDITNERAGERVVRLVPNHNISMELPDGVQIENAEPSRIPIRLERLIEQTREVKVTFEGQPAEGYEVRSIEITPARVRVRGPQSHIESLPNAPTETISLDGRRETFVEGQIAIDVQDQKIVTLDPIVSVRVQIEEQRIERTFTNVSVRLPDVNNEVLIEPNRATITLRAPRSIVERLRAEDLTIILARRDDGSFEPRLAFAVPEYSDQIELITTRPAQFSVGR
jgi:YbbR domain-containing protein